MLFRSICLGLAVNILHWSYFTRKRRNGAKIGYKTKHVLIASVTNKAGFHFPLSYSFFLKLFKFSNSKGIWLKIFLTWSWPKEGLLAEGPCKIYYKPLNSESTREKEHKLLLGHSDSKKKIRCNKWTPPVSHCLSPKINCSSSVCAANPNAACASLFLMNDAAKCVV